MSHREELLHMGSIQNCCREAFTGGEEALRTALMQMYREGFADSVSVPGANERFADRLLLVQREYRSQLEHWQRDAGGWLRSLPDALPPEEQQLLACGLMTAAAAFYAPLWQQERSRELIRLRAAQPAPREDVLKTLETFAAMPMEPVFFTGRALPEMTPSQTGIASGLLGMLAYIACKKDRPRDISPEISFDAVCLLSCACTHALCRDDLQGGTAVGAILACCCMHTPLWAAMEGCMCSLPALGLLLTDTLKSLCHMLLPMPGTRRRLSEAARNYSFDTHWMPLLEKGGEPAAAAPEKRVRTGEQQPQTQREGARNQ